MRKLVGAYACRNGGSRLYGKPMQFLDIKSRVSILEHMVDLAHTIPCISEVVLGVSEGNDNVSFLDFAERKGLAAIVGDEKDVLMRLILCCEHAKATDVFRVTTESPFFYYQKIEECWKHHISNANDVTVIDGLPEGCHFEIYRLHALKRSHSEGDATHRSEFCSKFIRDYPEKFKIEKLPVPKAVQRLDLRLTVDYPEDLVLCRAVYQEFKDVAPQIDVADIVNFLDGKPELRALVKPFVVPELLW